MNGAALAWALTLALAFPVLVVALGEFSHALQTRTNPFAATLVAVRNLVLPSLVVLLLLDNVLGYASTDTALRIVATVFWIFLLHASLLLMNAVLFESAVANSWRAHVPPLLLDMVRFFLVLLGAAVVLSTVWGIDLKGLLAALGLGSLVIGLALQETLGNMFSGIALLFEQPLRVGDWVEIGNQTGKVVSLNARSVNLENADGELIVVPNRTFAQERFRNLSHMGTFCHRMTFGFSHADPPNSVKSLLRQVARETRRVLVNPEPECLLLGYEELSIRYEIRLYVRDFAELQTICDEYSTRLWYAAQRHGLTMRAEAEPPQPQRRSEDEIVERLRTIPVLASVQRSTLQALAKGLEIQRFGKGELLIRQGEPGKALYIILKGQAVVTARNADGGEREVARLRDGEYFGELALLSSAVSNASVTATEDLEVVAIYPGPVREIVDNIPQLARELNATMARRNKETTAG